MGFFAQTWTLTKKNLLIVLGRHWFTTTVRAFLAPIIFFFIISYCKNFFVPPSDFGVGSPSTLRTFEEALRAGTTGRSTVAFVANNQASEVTNIINQLSNTVRASGKTPVTLFNEVELLQTCKSSVRGVSGCFAAVNFHGSPSNGGVWNYTIRTDGSLGERIFVNTEDNDAQIYALPLQHAVDALIASSEGSSIPLPQQYPYTDSTPEERERNITRLYMRTLIDILGLAYFIGFVGICYQLTGQMATEREIGMSQLIEAMMPNQRRWQPQAARLLSSHLAFDILYLPGWVISGAIVTRLNYPSSETGILIGYFIIAGLALSSWSIAFASLFRKAQLSGITVTIVSIVLAIIVQVQTPKSTGAIVVLSLLFPPMNFTLFIIYMAYWQRDNLAAVLSEAPPGSPWRVSGTVFFVLCAIQIVVYPLVGAFIERSLYGTASKARNMHHSAEYETARITNIQKQYSPGWFHTKIWSRFSKKQRETVHAVNDVSFTIRAGEIHVLLGANGAGKSTMMDLIAGLQSPTSGTIDINGSGGVGICPQKNVLWDKLTCEEHVYYFNQLKAEGQKGKSSDHQDLLSRCDLAHKISARSETLSGGQKRKLQLAMMLTGGSNLCLVDEVSSGIDPLSRRKVWDILLAERGHRAMLFTTHFLDEGDLLSDHITILSKGTLVASGTAVALKHELGGGYRVKIYSEHQFKEPQDWSSIPRRNHADHVVYNLPDSSAAAVFVTRLEQLGVTDYRVSGPSIEDVFLKLSAEFNNDHTLHDDATPLTNVSSIQSEKGLELAKGRRISLGAQTWVLFRKRLTILRRNYLPHMAAVLIPVIAGGLVTLFLKGFNPLSCSPEAASSNEKIVSFATLNHVLDFPAGPASRVPITLLGTLYPGLDNAIAPVASVDAFNEYVRSNYSRVFPGGYFDAQDGTPLFAWRGNYELDYAILTQNVLDSSLLGSPIITSYQAFQVPWAPSAGKTLQFILYFGLAMSAYPGFFALYPTNERVAKVRALHYSNGIRAFPLWLAYTVFDFMFVMIVSVVTIVIFVGVSSALYAPGTLFVVFFLYGLAALLCSYVISLFVTSQLASFAFAAGMQCAFFLIYFIAYMATITYAPTEKVDDLVTIIHFTLGLITPSGNLLRSLLLTFNEFSLLCHGDERASYAGDITVYGGPILYLLVQSLLLLGFLVYYDSGYRPAFLSRKARSHDAEESEYADEDVYHEAMRVNDCDDELRVCNISKSYGDNLAVDRVAFGVPRGEIFALLGPNGAGKSTSISLIRGDVHPSAGDVFLENESIVKHRAAARLHQGVCPQFDAMDALTASEHLHFYARARGVTDVEHNVEQVMDAVGLSAFRNRMASKLSGGNKRKLSLGIALIGNPSVLLVDEGSSGMDAGAKRIMWRTLSAVSSGRSLVLTTHSLEEADALGDRVGIMARRMLAIGTSDYLRRKHGDAYYVHLVHQDAPHTSDAKLNEIKDWIRINFPLASIEDRSFHGQIRFEVPNRAASIEDDTSSSVNGKKGARATVTPTDRNGISSLFEKLEASKAELGMEFYAVSQATLDQVFLNIVGKHNVQEEDYQKARMATGAWGKTKAWLRKTAHDA
ncbi:putative ABC transporter [Aureobasidium sp. EXF-12298]|nr:putative ABC transporter [Aureobasidium sp. EXF-12298]KAI4766127.1 putative ABC transporter [Aureobasidium sp. EXF-12344]KAI4783638.1 putative ABC transporter [Aureobasidium sp. EXF-3400]